MTNDRAKDLYNQAAYIAQSLHPILEEMKDTTDPQHQLKYHLNQAMKHAEKLMSRHFFLYQNHGEVVQPDGTRIHSADVHRITAVAYDKLLHRPASEVVTISKIADYYDTNNIDYTDFSFEYKKMLK